MAYDDKKLLEIINGQGYLLQQAVEQTVKAAGLDHKIQWSMVSTEHLWEHTQHTGYADLIIADEDGMLGVIECKRFAEETPWIFLCPKRESHVRDRSMLHWAHTSGGVKQSGWAEFTHGPITYFAKFCIVPGQAKDRPMLERVAGELLYSVESLAAQHSSLYERKTRGAIFLPIIVTTAQLYVCKYDEKKIDGVYS